MHDLIQVIKILEPHEVKELNNFVDNCGLTIEEIQSRSVPAGKTSYIVDKSEVPTDRSFRNAWTYTP